ncbi:hypothetical protein QJS10_CPB13g00913 [Acorus calamus]|uniref:Uncharacterized protein n=1 Tax=Acorus calamus TaxID=4465 RepID=A0AAV9DJI7_ACOCL|nr:hypothetical protein QJS10_CPB13g00913 [Acorus calamus]
MAERLSLICLDFTILSITPSSYVDTMPWDSVDTRDIVEIYLYKSSHEELLKIRDQEQPHLIEKDTGNDPGKSK